jgi:hypothetical protein
MVETDSKRIKVAAKFNRCVVFTLPSGQVIEVKVLGEKADAALASKALVAAFTN